MTTTLADNPGNDYESVREYAGDRMAAIMDLYDWSKNHDHPSPWIFFLDLVGYSQDNFGETLYEGKRIYGQHIDLDYLADALKCWAVRPNDARDLIAKIELMED